MTTSTKLSLIAAAMGGLMAGASAHAMASTSAPVTSSSRTTTVNTNKDVQPVNAGVRALDESKDAGKHDCKGKNDCKGQGGCKSSDNGCKAKNSCKGQGGCSTKGEKKTHVDHYFR